MLERLLNARSDLKIQVRGQLEPGLSGANVILVDFQSDGERRLGVLKVTTAVKAQREIEGDHRARQTWLKPFLPDFMVSLESGSDESAGLLISLAKDRIENCETLRAALTGSYRYAKDYVLRNISQAYSREAAARWTNTTFRPVREHFSNCINNLLPTDWEERWRLNHLPPPEAPTFVFDDLPARWPNPIAYLTRADLWPKDSDFGITIPWITSHGDLNCGNVLCPSAQRSLALSLVSGQSNAEFKFGQRMLDFISLIDMPFCREAPFTFDLAFLTTWLGFLLPDSDTRANRDVILTAYRALVATIRDEHEPVTVPSDAAKFVECFAVMAQSIFAAQPRMAEDIKKSLLCSLASAATWQAIRIGTKKDSTERERQEAIHLLCLSAITLEALLGPHISLGSVANDYALEVSKGAHSRKPWTPSASVVGDLLRECSVGNTLILVLGRDWDRFLELPTEDTLLRLPTLKHEELVQLANVAIGSEQVSSARVLAKLPISVVFDWSVFPATRTAISELLSPPRYVRPLVPGDKEPPWSQHEAVMYVHLRGSVENIASVAGNAPSRNQARAKLRNALSRYRDFRVGELKLLYVGLSATDLKETHSFLQEFWNQKATAFWLAPEQMPDAVEFCTEWNIQIISGGIEDFITASEDAAEQAVPASITSLAPVIRVADMTRGVDGTLVSKPGAIIDIEISSGDFEAISRAGQLLCESDRVALSVTNRDPKQFFIGYPIEFSELHAGIAVERMPFAAYLSIAKKELAARHLQTVSIVSRPGAGASTALRWLAYQLRFKENVPVLVLKQGGVLAFEAIERLYRIVGRSFIVLADPQDVPTDDLAGLKARCAPARYPVVFLNSSRALRRASTDMAPVIEIELTDSERVELLQRLAHYCPTVPVQRLLASPTRSLFLLTLEAFGEANVRVDRYVSQLLGEAGEAQGFLLATIAFFSRYAHRSVSLDILQVLIAKGVRDIEHLLAPFDQLLVLKEGDCWICRHDQLSKAILQCHLTKSFDEQYRYDLCPFVCSILDAVAKAGVGKEIAADYIWAILNPQVEAEPNATGERPQQSRLIGGEDGLPAPTARHQVFLKATEVFPDHVNINAHFGKYLAEEEAKFADADKYLMLAQHLEPKNAALPHMIGKRYLDEIRVLVKTNPPVTRDQAVDEKIQDCVLAAHQWFAKGRELDLSSEFGYTTAIQLNIRLVRDEFQRMGVRSAAEDPSVLSSDRIMALLAEAESLVAEGQRYIVPRPENRRVFNQARDSLHQLRGDLNTAIKCFETHVKSQRGLSQALAKVQLARLLQERGEYNFVRGERGKANRDFAEGERQLFDVLQDSNLKFKNIKLWFDCARHVPHWRRPDFLLRLHQLHEHDPNLLDPVFLLMCLYFCEAIETSSVDSWRHYQEFQRKSSARSAMLAIRRYVREWLVKVSVGAPGATHDEYRIFPHHYFEGPDSSNSGRSKGQTDSRARLSGVVARVESSTEGYLLIPPMGFEVFFRPRAGDKFYYKSDAERRTPVTFSVGFNYEKPEAYDVERLTNS